MEHALGIERTVAGKLWLIVLERDEAGLKTVADIFETEEANVEKGFRQLRKQYPELVATHRNHGQWNVHANWAMAKRDALAHVRQLEGK